MKDFSPHFDEDYFRHKKPVAPPVLQNSKSLPLTPPRRPSSAKDSKKRRKSEKVKKTPNIATWKGPGPDIPGVSSSEHVQINKKYEGLFTEPIWHTDKSHILAIFMHPYGLFGGKMQEPIIWNCHKAFASKGYHCLSFNFTGVGRSKGNLDWWGNGDREAAKECISWGLQYSTTCTSVVIVGHSYGSLVGFSILPDISALCIGCVLISPPLGNVASLGFGHLVEKGKNCTTPLFFVLGTEDQFTSLDALKSTMKKIPRPKLKALMVKNGTHTWDGMLEVVVDKVLLWVSQLVVEEELTEENAE